MKIAVIGAAGFIGTRVVERLHLAREHTAVPIARTPAGLARATRFDLVGRTADARDTGALRAALRGCEAVVHAIAARGPRDYDILPAALGAAAAAEKIRRVIFLSSSLVHGLVPDAGSNEHSPLHTAGAPAEIAGRIRAERIFFEQCRSHDLEGIALRPTLVYGPRSPWFAQLARDLREGRAAWLEEGRGLCNCLYVDNLVSAIFSALAAPASATGRPYLVGDVETVTWREFYLATARWLGVSPARIANLTALPAAPLTKSGPLRRLVKRLLPEAPPPEIDPWAAPEIPAPTLSPEAAAMQRCRWRFPNQRAIRALGFQPPVPFAEGLKRSVAWLAFAEGASLRPTPPSPVELTEARPTNILDVLPRG